MNHAIVHITTRTIWADAQAGGGYTAPSLGRDGFIHFSTPEQVLAAVTCVLDFPSNADGTFRLPFKP